MPTRSGCNTSQLPFSLPLTEEETRRMPSNNRPF